MGCGGLCREPFHQRRPCLRSTAFFAVAVNMIFRLGLSYTLLYSEPIENKNLVTMLLLNCMSQADGGVADPIYF